MSADNRDAMVARVVVSASFARTDGPLGRCTFKEVFEHRRVALSRYDVILRDAPKPSAVVNVGSFSTSPSLSRLNVLEVLFQFM